VSMGDNNATTYECSYNLERYLQAREVGRVVSSRKGMVPGS